MKWSIELTNLGLGGFAPAFWESSYPQYGNKNMAGDMQNCNLFDPAVLTQGFGLSTLTNGDQTGAITTLVRSILRVPHSSDVAYAVGGDKVYKFSSTAVVNSGGKFPHTITVPLYSGIVADDIIHAISRIYYVWHGVKNGTTNEADFGMYDTNADVFDDDWGSSLPPDTNTLNYPTSPHQLCLGGNGHVYISDGSYVDDFDGSNLILGALDIAQTDQIQSIKWYRNRLYILSNSPGITTASNKNWMRIYVWDGNSDSWEEQPVDMPGVGGALYELNGILYVFYQDVSSTGGYKLAYLDGTQLIDVANFTGSLPAYYQVSDLNGFLVWVSSGEIWAWGSNSNKLPDRLFQLADGGYSSVGGIAAPFGSLLIGSNQTTSYKLAKLTGYDTACTWYSLLYDVTGNGKRSVIDKVQFLFDKLATGARCDWTIKDNAGTSLATGTISYSGDGAVTYKEVTPLCDAHNLRIELNWANGSATNPVAFRGIKIYGHTRGI